MKKKKKIYSFLWWKNEFILDLVRRILQPSRFHGMDFFCFKDGTQSTQHK